jgi:hypothetical protein
VLRGTMERCYIQWEAGVRHHEGTASKCAGVSQAASRQYPRCAERRQLFLTLADRVVWRPCQGKKRTRQCRFTRIPGKGKGIK